jgi:hypothetical protein
MATGYGDGEPWLAKDGDVTMVTMPVMAVMEIMAVMAVL